MSRELQGTVRIRAGTAADLPRLNELYNHYVARTPATFDITPITPRARVLTSFEATFGVLYIAIVIAGLVGASRRSPPPGGRKNEAQGG